MGRIRLVYTIICIAGIVGCGGRQLPLGFSDKTPNLQGTWTVVLSGAAPFKGGTPPPSTTLTVMFNQLNQDRNNLLGTVLSVNNPASSCLSTLNDSATFTVSGNVTHPIEAGANLLLEINFSSGSSLGTISVNGAATDSAANGSFNFTPNTGCTGGGFSMTRVF
jgi:hypothetical protein